LHGFLLPLPTVHCFLSLLRTECRSPPHLFSPHGGQMLRVECI
jgi:hypothetical protein